MQYAQLRSNFSSAYNVSPPAPIYHHPVPISTRKYDDLYYSDDYSISPTSSILVHHHHVAPSPPPIVVPQTVSKLRQINDELCQTLAQCDLSLQSSSSVPSRPIHTHHVVHQNHHHHHHPISQRSLSISDDEQFSFDESEPIVKPHRAKVNYGIRIPRRSRSQLDELLISTSDVYSHDDPMTVDIYPTRDNGFVRQIRDRPDNQRPWLEDLRIPSPTPSGPYYDNDHPLTPPSRLANTRRPTRVRRDSAPNLLRHSVGASSAVPPAWRPGGTIKHGKFIGSNAPPSPPRARREPAWNPGGPIKRPKFMGSNAPASPPRVRREPTWHPGGVAKKTKPIAAFDPTPKAVETKTAEPTLVWKPSSKTISHKVPEYFEPTVEVKKKDTPPVAPKRIEKKPKRVSSADPQLRRRISEAQSKVKSTWTQPTVSQPARRVVKPPPSAPPAPPSRPRVPPSVPTGKKPLPKPIEKIDVDTGRSSLPGMPTNPIYQSTPLDQSLVTGGDGGGGSGGGAIADFYDDDKPQIDEPATPSGPVVPPQPSRPVTPSETSQRTEVPKSTNENELKSPKESHQSPPRTPPPAPESINRDDEDENTIEDFDEPSINDDPTPAPATPTPDPVIDESVHSVDEHRDDEEEHQETKHETPVRSPSPPKEPEVMNSDEADSFFN